MTKNSSSPFPQFKPRRWTPSSQPKNSTTIEVDYAKTADLALNFKGSKKELVEWVKKNNSGKKRGDKSVISANAAIKLWRTKNPTKENKPPEKKPTSNVTLQEARDTFYNKEEFKDKGYFQNIDEPTTERAKEISKAHKSGYLTKLRNAVNKKYGVDAFKDISNEEDAQMAGDAMIDKDGNILPMSSASGGWSGDNTSRTSAGHFQEPVYHGAGGKILDPSGEVNDERTKEHTSAFNMKKTRGYKMPGFGKR